MGKKEQGSSARKQVTDEDAGSKYVRERVFLPNHRCSVQRGKASERERVKETRVLTNTEDDTEKQENG